MKGRHLRDRLRELVKFDEPPRRLALAFALGTFVAFSPWIGLHIISAIAFAWLFRLNKVVVLTASLINNPWTIVPLYAFCLWFGIKITGSGARLPAIDWKHLGISDVFAVVQPLLVPFLAGTLVVGGATALAGYYLFLWAVKKYREQEDQCAETGAPVEGSGRNSAEEKRV